MAGSLKSVKKERSFGPAPVTELRSTGKSPGDVTLDPESDGRCVEASQSQIRFGQKFAERVNVRERDRIERHTLDYRTTDSVR